MNCEFHLPGRILFGCGERRGLPGLLAPGNVLIVTGRHSRRRVEAELLPALEGRTVRLVSDASPEPPIPDVERIIAAGGRSMPAASSAGAAAPPSTRPRPPPR